MVQFLNSATLFASKFAITDSDSTTDKNIFCQSLLRCGCPTGFSRLLTGVYYGDDGDGDGVDDGDGDGDGGSATQQASAGY